MSGRIVIVGSGETSPTMVKAHRTLMEQAGEGTRIMLDTPFGFQANADDLTEKIQEYFAQSVGIPVGVARWRRRDESVASRERALGQLDRASWAFAGPGSPSYALRQWQGTPVPPALLAVVARGGTAVLGSAAAVTVGSHAIPVYEIYKVGDDPAWIPGLDLLGEVTGIRAAVIPHYDNREGGRHDTRFCYLGSQRLEFLESTLPDGVGVLGVDEHTAVVIDRSSATATVHGAGGLTLRYRGVEEVIAAGESIALADVARIVSGAQHGPVVTSHAAPQDVAADAGDDTALSLGDTAAGLQRRFDACITEGDAEGALGACLDLEEAIHAWSSDTLQSDDLDVARRSLRSMIVDLAAAAETGLQDAREVLGPLVQVALDARQAARDGKDFALSDAIRDGLAGAGVEVRDTPDGMVWDLRES